MSQPHPTTWLNEVSFCLHPQCTWQATAYALVGPIAGALDTMHSKGVPTYSPPDTCGSCLRQTLKRKRINASANEMLECVDGTSSGADVITMGVDDNFAYAYVCLPSADICVTSADVIKSWLEKLNNGCKQNLVGHK